MSNKIVALLPIKANSERIKNKNFKNFNGKPLFQWVLELLIKNKNIHQIVINTDAKTILKKYGIDNYNKLIIRDRKPELCGNMITANELISDDITSISAQFYLQTHVTSPLISDQTINKAINLFKKQVSKNKADSLFCVNKVQTRFYDKNCVPINHNPHILTRTQDIVPWFEDNSVLYLFSGDSFYKNNTRIGEHPIMFKTPYLESFDIDTPEEWEMAEIIGRHLSNKKHIL